MSENNGYSPAHGGYPGTIEDEQESKPSIFVPGSCTRPESHAAHGWLEPGRPLTWCEGE